MITDDKRATSILKEFKANMETPSYKCVYTKNEVLWAVEVVLHRMENPIIIHEKDDDEDDEDFYEDDEDY